jgi:hypothetical protein
MQRMKKLNWPRIVLCGLLAGIVWIVLGSVVTGLLGRDFAALPNNRLANPTTGFIVSNVVIDLLEGISVIWLYAVLRPVYGVGVKTGVIAAFAWWLIVSLGDATWCSFGFFPPRTVIPLMIGTLPALILAALVGARFYKDQDHPLPIGSTSSGNSVGRSN